MTRRETPTEWVELLEKRRLHSIRDLAGALGVSPQTATRLVHGEQTSRETLEAAADLLGVSPDRIREMRQEAAPPPFRLPPEADQLGQRQRAAVVAAVRAMLESKHEAPIDPRDEPSGDGRSIEQAIEADPDLLPEARAHLLNQVGLLRRLQAPRAVPDRVPTPEELDAQKVKRLRAGRKAPKR